MTINIGGAAVNTLTIDGDVVQEVTVDGNVVYVSETILDDFEDGDVAEWNVSFGTFEVDTGTVPSDGGTYSARTKQLSDSVSRAYRGDNAFPSDASTFKVTMLMDRISSGGSQDWAGISFRNSGQAAEVGFATDGTSELYWDPDSSSGRQSLRSYSNNTFYNIQIDVDWSGGTADVYIDGTLEGSNLSLISTQDNGYQRVTVNHQAYDGSSAYAYFDNIIYQ